MQADAVNWPRYASKDVVDWWLATSTPAVVVIRQGGRREDGEDGVGSATGCLKLGLSVTASCINFLGMDFGGKPIAHFTRANERNLSSPFPTQENHSLEKRS